MAKRQVPAIELRHIERSYVQGETSLEVLTGASLTVDRGEIIGLMGPSGSGKSTLLHIAALLEAPTAGHVLIGGADCALMSDSQRTRIRREELGFVYQFHHLLPEFTALENVILPQMIAGRSRAHATLEATRLLNELGLGARIDHQPMQMSGGEQQRVAIARALANKPHILLADEPTGNLDPKTAATVFDALLKLVRDEALAAVIATHNYNLVERMDRIVELRDGKLVDSAKPN